MTYYRFESFQSESHVYMVFDYIQGGEIFRLLRRETSFPNDVALFFSTEIVQALKYLHANGVVYRDLKPENVLVILNNSSFLDCVRWPS